MSKDKACFATGAFVLFLAAWALLGWPFVLMPWACMVAIPLLLGMGCAVE